MTLFVIASVAPMLGASETTLGDTVGLWGLTLGVLTALTSAVVFFWGDDIRRWPHLRTLRVEIDVPKSLQPGEYEFFVRHVRDGKDALDEKGRLRNRDIRFHGGARRHAYIRHDGRLGVQYKCFVSCPRDRMDYVEQQLERHGFLEVSRSLSGRPRVWFLSDTGDRCTTVDGHVNNFGFVAESDAVAKE